MRVKPSSGISPCVLRTFTACAPHVQTKTGFNVELGFELSKADKQYTMQHAQIKSVLQTVDFVSLIFFSIGRSQHIIVSLFIV